jgi:hypothetical protein
LVSTPFKWLCRSWFPVLEVQFVFALLVACRATKKFIDGHLFLDEDRLEEKEAQRRNIPMHVFCGFLEKLARDVEQELARQKALKLPTAQFEATLDSLRRHQSVLELRFSPHLSFSLAACPLFFALALALSFSPSLPHSLTPSPSPSPSLSVTFCSLCAHVARTALSALLLMPR